MKKLLIVMLALTMVFAFAATALAATVSATVPAASSAKLTGGTGDTLTVAYSSTTTATADTYYKLTVTGGTASVDSTPALITTGNQITGFSATGIAFATTGAKTVTWTLKSCATVDGTYTTVSSANITVYVGKDGKAITFGSLTAPATGTFSVDGSNTKLYHIHVPSGTSYLEFGYSGLSDGATISTSATVSPTALSTNVVSDFTVTVSPENGEAGVTYTFDVEKDYDLHAITGLTATGISGISINDSTGTITGNYSTAYTSFAFTGRYSGASATEGSYTNATEGTGVNQFIDDPTNDKFTVTLTPSNTAQHMIFTVTIDAPNGIDDQLYTVDLTPVAVTPELDGLKFYTTATGTTAYAVSSKTVTVGSSANIIYVTPQWASGKGEGTLTISGNAVASVTALASGRYQVDLTTSGTTLVIAASGTIDDPDGYLGTYTLDRTSTLVSGKMYKSSSTTSSGVSFDFASGDYTESINVSSSWELDDGDSVYLDFEQSVSSVKYTNDSQSTKKSADTTGTYERYEIPVDGTTEVYFTYNSKSYTLTIEPGEGVISVKVYDSDKEDYESATFTSTSKTVNVSEDWDSDNVYLKFGATVSNVKYGPSSSDTTSVSASSGYYKVELDGTTYVWFKYNSTTYKLTIKPDGSTSTDQLIDTVEANAKSSGSGDDYLAFADNSGNKVYVFRPYDNRSDSIYLKISSDYEVNYNDSSSDSEGKWVSVEDEDTVTVDGEEFDIVVYTGAKSDADDDTLDALSVKAGTKSSSLSSVTLSPTFASGTKSYTAYIGSTNTVAQITAKLGDSNAYMVIDGYGLYNTSSSKSWTFEGLKTSTSKFTYTVHVIAEDCETEETYTLNLVRTGGTTALSALSVSGGTLTPSFLAKTLSYTSYTSGSSTTISATADDSTATVTITGYTAANGSLGSKSGTGSAYGTFNLAEGLNTFTVSVSKSGSTATTYYVSVYRVPSAPKITVSKQSISVNGSSYTLAAYNINGNNFVKLRDLAALLMNTGKKFSLVFNDGTQTATMTMGGTYTKRGDELTALPAYKRYSASSQLFILDSTYIYPMAYNIDGTNYVMIRDMGSAMNFYVGYTASTKTIVINTSSNYTPNN